MAKVESRYLKRTFEVASYESQENGDTIQVISHEALENIIHNQIPAEVGVRYDFQDMCITRNHCVVRCTITDAAGRRVQQIGETVPETLETEISKNYPALMASNRAFDRAVIRYLDLPGKTLSNLENNFAADAVNNGETTVNVGEKPPKEAPIGQNNAPTQPAANQAPAQNAGSQPAGGNTRPAQKQNAPAANNHPAPAAAAAAPSNTVPQGYDPGAVLCNVGSKYRNKPTAIAEMYKTDAGYVKWLAEKYSGTTEEAKKIRQAAIDYLKQVGGNS